MQLPEDVLSIIKEYSRPKYPYWRAGSYVFKQLKIVDINLLEELQYWIILKKFSYCPINYLRIEYNLLKHNTRYRKYVNGEIWNGQCWIGSIYGYWHPHFGPKIPRPINFSHLIGNTQKLLKDAYSGKKMNCNRIGFATKRDVEWYISYQIHYHKEMKLRYPDRLFGYIN